MKIVIINITGGGLSGGYKKYLHSIIELIKADARVTDLLVVVPPLSGLDLIQAYPCCISWEKGDEINSFSRLKALISSWNPDVIFLPNPTWVDFGTVPVVTMIQNMEMVSAPVGGNSILDICKNLVRRHRAKIACKNSARVIAISNFVKDYLIEKWRFPSTKVGLVYFGVDQQADNADVSNISNRIVGGGRFFLVAGSVRPYRGIEDAILAHSLALKDDKDITLVIAGKADPGSEWYELRMKKLIKRLGIVDRVLWTGLLGRSDLGALMRSSIAFVMTSRVEACPNIALEAMAMGARILSTRSSPMPEFFESIAYYYEKANHRELSKIMLKAMRDSSDVDSELRKLAIRKSLRFKWSECASKTVTELLSVCNKPEGLIKSIS